MRILILICIGILGVFTVSCKRNHSPFQEKKQYLRLNIHSEPPTLDPRKASDTSSLAIIKMCFEGLMKRGKDGKIIPALAHKIDISEDQKTYTFYLRDAKWWDGKAITAYDFEQTWKSQLDPSFPSVNANELYLIKNAQAAKQGHVSLEEVGIKALDAKTLEVQLNYPTLYFLDLITCSSFFAVPTHIVQKSSNWASKSGQMFVGNGPFQLVNWRHHNFLLLEKNQNYWDKENVILEKIHLHVIEDENTELNMFESGELDWAGYPLSTLPSDAIQALAEQNRLKTYLLSGTYYYIFNVNNPPFNNLNFRKAFALAIHRQAIIDNIMQCKQLIATGLIPPTIWETKAFFQDNDVAKAKELFNLALKEMGYTRETLPEITLSYNTVSAHHKVAQAIQEQWFQAFGIRVKLQNKEWKVFLDELSNKQFQVARMGGVANFKDPVCFFDLYKYEDSCNNYSGWTNKEFSRLLEEAGQIPDQIAREKLLRKAEQIFMDAMPIIPIYYYVGAYVQKPYVRDIHVSEFHDVEFKFAFVEM